MCYHVTQKTATVLFGKIPELPLLFFLFIGNHGLCPKKGCIYYETD